MISQVTEVPSPFGLRPSGLEDAPDALRRAGLHERLGSPDALRVDVPPYDGVRDPETGVLNPLLGDLMGLCLLQALPLLLLGSPRLLVTLKV